MKFTLANLTLAAALLAPLTSYGQDTTEQTPDQSERIQRREPLEGLTPEEREARRSEMRARFENLSEEERAAIQQRRQERAQNHQRDRRILRQAKGRKDAANNTSSPETSTTPPA